jgi:hypothetical protein
MKNLISKCCGVGVHQDGNCLTGYICDKCNEYCICDTIEPKEEKEEVKGKIKDLEDIMQSIKEIIIGNSIWRKYPDGHTDFNEMNLDKILCLIATSISELLDNQETTTPDNIYSIKPKSHKEEKQLPMTFNGKTFNVDETIYDLVKLLNDNYKQTVASCSGHGFQPISIAFKDRTEMLIMTYEQARKVDKLFPDINGERMETPTQNDWIKNNGIC